MGAQSARFEVKQEPRQIVPRASEVVCNRRGLPRESNGHQRINRGHQQSSLLRTRQKKMKMANHGRRMIPRQIHGLPFERESKSCFPCSSITGVRQS